MSNYIGTPKEISQYLWNLDQNKQYEIKEYYKKRTLDANSYCWVLCKEIADKLHISKEEVYKKNIKDMGKFEIIPIKNEALNTFINAWTSKGIGWLCEVLRESKIEGYTTIIVYYGSSVYDTKEMSILIDGVVQECTNLGIPTITGEELNKLKGSWKNDKMDDRGRVQD